MRAPLAFGPGLSVLFLVTMMCGLACRAHAATAVPPRNVILFVADGLRPGMVTPEETPTFARLAAQGVRFANSHALFPSLTTANASALATGHYLGDTADFGNVIYIGYRLFAGGAFSGKSAASYTPFLENDLTLADINQHMPGGNYLDEETLTGLARRRGLQTAVIGKLGPVLIQDAAEAKAAGGAISVPATIVVDDATGKAGGVPLPPDLVARLQAANLSLVAPGRDNHARGTADDNANPGDLTRPGTQAANTEQQAYFVDVLTKAVLPDFAAAKKPFFIVYWSRDPDGSQHNQGDSLGKLVPGINGPTSKAGIRNADANLQRILAALAKTPQLAAATDVVITSDHGFSTISHRDLDANERTFTQAYPSKLSYKNALGAPTVAATALPLGFLAIDIAHALGLPLYDPDTALAANFAVVDPTGAAPGSIPLPAEGNGLIGGSGRLSPTDAKIIVAADGGTDLIYVPSGDAALVRQVAAFLAKQDYVGGVFADDSFGVVPGALPLSAINLKGTALLPTPSLVASFRTFCTDPAHPFTTQVEIADTPLQQGQGMHGSFGRGDTFNFMVAYGPDFKAGFVDPAPASNADLPVTMAHVLGLALPAKGHLRGRVLEEALRGGKSVKFIAKSLRSAPDAASGATTVLNYQEVGDVRYFDAAGFAGRTNGLKP